MFYHFLISLLFHAAFYGCGCHIRWAGAEHKAIRGGPALWIPEDAHGDPNSVLIKRVDRMQSECECKCKCKCESESESESEMELELYFEFKFEFDFESEFGLEF